MNLIYKFVDKFLMNDFSKIISQIVNDNHKTEITVFDVGCFQGNFSRSLKKSIKKKINFFLFDPNPNLKIKDFKYNELAFSNEKGLKKYHLNTFFSSVWIFTENYNCKRQIVEFYKKTCHWKFK